MDLTYVAIVVLASMIFILSGMVGYLYWQQTRLLQQLQTLALVVASRIQEQQPVSAPEQPQEEEEEDEVEDDEEVDDRVEIVEGPVEVKQEAEIPTVEEIVPPTTEPAVDVDDLQSKTVKELHEILSKKGIPFGKRDAKPILIQLLKATA